ncbi:MAG TPA: metal-dependent transcriptional regulator [Planctomycetaceae bacterium]|jgi:DtxR family Mn-dependent transcriptional regulator|nr:metal-dependent transcriptional regulator [Planctomycetaceae bacterium]
MTSLTVENYLKTAWQIAARQESPWVTTGQLATALHVSPGTVTSMLKTLAESGLAEYRPYEGACLTAQGKTLALRMLRRHRLIELFLARTLQLRWDQVHEEAEHMEHAVSDFLVDRIDEYLGLPTHDPHGDPIPSTDGRMRGDATSSKPLAVVSAGERVRVTRVTNQGREFLQFLTDSGMQLGCVGVVRQNNLEAGIMMIEVDGKPVAIGLPAAQQILVEPVSHAASMEA